MLVCQLLQALTQALIGAYPAGHNQATAPALFQRTSAFDQQGINHGILERTRDIRAQLLPVFHALLMVLPGIQREGFQSAETEDDTRIVFQGPRKTETADRAPPGRRSMWGPPG